MRILTETLYSDGCCSCSDFLSIFFEFRVGVEHRHKIIYGTYFVSFFILNITLIFKLLRLVLMVDIIKYSIRACSFRVFLVIPSGFLCPVVFYRTVSFFAGFLPNSS